MKAITVLLGLVGGSLTIYLGLFLIGYRGDTAGGGDIYVNVGDTRIDADLVGIPLATLGLIAVATSVIALRRRVGR